MRLLKLTIAALCCSAGPLKAQQITYSDSATQSCVAVAAGDFQQEKGCIGQSADMCMQVTNGGFSTAAMSACSDKELSYWDGILNVEYGRLRDEARRIDAAGESNLPAKEFENALRDMQRAWIGYRDATCIFEAVQWRGGTGTGPAVIDCRMRLTGQQALLLKNTQLAY